MSENIINDGLDKEAVIIARTIEGTFSSMTTLTVVREGLREEFIPADDDEPLQDSNGEIFAVLK